MFCDAGFEGVDGEFFGLAVDDIDFMSCLQRNCAQICDAEWDEWWMGMCMFRVRRIDKSNLHGWYAPICDCLDVKTPYNVYAKE